MENNMESDDEILIKGRKFDYSLPKFRYINIVLAFIFLDGTVSMVLWLCGGDSDYFIDSIVSYDIKHSTFDLAVLACVKVIVMAPAVTYLEYVTLKQINHTEMTHLRKISGFLHFIIVTLTLLAISFTAVKGGLILNALMHEGTYQHMHPTYNALLITAVVFSIIEFILALLGFYFMRRLKKIRILHLYNDDGVEVDKDGKPVEKKVDLVRLMSLAKPELPLILCATLCLFVTSGSQMLAPLFFGKVVDSAKKGMDELNRTVLTLFIIYVFGAVFALGRSWLFTLAGQRVVARLRKNLFLSIIKQDVAFFDTNRTGELCNRLSSDTQVLQNAVTVNISMLSRYVLQMIGSLILMFTLNAKLTAVLLAVVPIVSVCAVQYGMFMKKLSKQFQDRLGEAGTEAEESLSSIRTVRTFSAENKACDLYNKYIDKSYNVGKKLAAAGGIFEGGVGILVSGSITLVLWYGGKLVHENYADPTKGITPGILTAFLLYTLQVAMAFALMSSLYGDFMKALGASIRVFDLLDKKPEVYCENGERLIDFDGCIEYKNVDFTYPSRPETQVVKNVSLTVEPGQMVALVGPSGGGKSTLVNLLERFYDPDSGSIYLGGANLKDLDPKWFRQCMSMVSQEPTLFACSIKDNIAYGKNATLDEIIAVAKEANAHEFISTFEDGYDTLVGERGVRLSGGQKQRVAIARALIMNPKVLLLDEATSALDAESEHLVQEAIDRAMKGRTIIVIAHRLSTVRNASKVVVIDKGEIVEVGTHDDLLSANGVYKKLVLRQLTAGNIIEKMINGDNDRNDDDDDARLVDI